MRAGDEERVDLEPFRDGVAVLRQGPAVVGHVATVVDEFRGLLLVRQPRVWFLVTWLDGTRERIEEDYPPWTAVAEMSAGHLALDRGDFRIEWLSGPDREDAWKAFGIHDAVEAYM